MQLKSYEVPLPAGAVCVTTHSYSARTRVVGTSLTQSAQPTTHRLVATGNARKRNIISAPRRIYEDIDVYVYIIQPVSICMD